MINHVANAILKNKDFLQLLKDGPNKFQSSEELQKILNTNKRKIKVFRDDENDVIYIIEKTIDETRVYREKIYDFNKSKK